MSVGDIIRKLLTVMLALIVLLWTEAGLALLMGDQVVQCRAMPTMMHSHSQAVADDAMPCCPADPGRTPKPAASHPPCCSSSEVPERPLAFLVNSNRAVSHLLDTVAEVPAKFAPPLAHNFGELKNPDAPLFVKPVLDLKSDLRI
jgi:hypothetical protein